ncbi:MAG TPA: GNAT family N-acetyltransferase [Chitinophagaceae bacterium]|nr:GNAT family N-acetyltransferase [Chitinophagaceae bacterium]
MEIKQALSKEEFINCWEVVHEFRPQLDLDHYLNLVLQMLDESYKMLYVEVDNKTVAICSYRYITLLQRGKSIYIDDLYTLEAHRDKGYATALLQQVTQEAKQNALQSIHLDSEHQLFNAHRLYLNNDFKITAHHFSLELTQ